MPACCTHRRSGDLLLTLGAADAYDVRWSEEILDEVTRNVVKDYPDIDRQRFIEHTIGAMRRAFPDAIIEPDEDVIEAMDNDAKDRRVAATAVGCGADAIVTLNVKDFRGAALPAAGVDVVTPGALISSLVDEDVTIVPFAIRTIAARLRQPSLSPQELASLLARQPSMEPAMRRLDGLL